LQNTKIATDTDKVIRAVGVRREQQSSGSSASLVRGSDSGRGARQAVKMGGAWSVYVDFESISKSLMEKVASHAKKGVAGKYLMASMLIAFEGMVLA